MKEKSVRVIRSIAKVALLLCGIFLLLLGVYYTYRSIRFRPYKVRVSNVTDSAFTVSWVTDEPMVGVVYYGEKDTFLPGPLSWLGKKKALDDRDVSEAQTDCVSRFNRKVSKSRDENFTVDAGGFDCHEVRVFKKGNYYTHHVTVGNLEADKEYFFRVGNGFISYKTGKTEGVKYIEREMPAISEFKQSTKPLITEVSSPKPAYGTSYNVYYTNDGGVAEKKNFDSLIFLRTFKSGDEYPLMSSVTNIDGGWSIDLSNVRKADGKPLEMENTYLEFIPQVDNARPGASGTTKFEALTFPLNLMGNNVDDLNKEQGEAVQLGLRLNDLVSGVMAYGYDDEDRVECWKIGDCDKRGVYQNSCPSGYAPTKSQCLAEPVQPPKPNPLCCTSSCSCNNRYAQCPGGFTQYESKLACQSAMQAPSQKVSCCTPLGQSDCRCITNREAGSCGGSYPQEYKTNNLSEAKAQCKAKLPPVTNNCYTYKESDNSCDGPKACTSGTLSFRQCEDKREEKLNLPTKTCCKVVSVNENNMSASCTCEYNKSSCSEGFKEYQSKDLCEDNQNDGGTRVCKGQCKDGKQCYLFYKIGGGLPDTRANVLTNIFPSLGDLLVKRSYAVSAVSPSSKRGVGETCTNSRNCQAGDYTSSATTGIKDTCDTDKEGWYGCKLCWSTEDCFLVKVNQKEDCPENYKEGSVCQPDFSKLKAGKAEGRNIQMETVKKNCTNNDTLEPKRGVTMTVVSGNCEENCWAHYKNSDGSVCGNIQLDDSVYCENIYCSDKQKQILTELDGKKCRDIVCDYKGGCVCPEECGAANIRNNEACDIEPLSPPEVTDTKRLCEYNYETGKFELAGRDVEARVQPCQSIEDLKIFLQYQSMCYTTDGNCPTVEYVSTTTSSTKLAQSSSSMDADEGNICDSGHTCICSNGQREKQIKLGMYCNKELFREKSGLIPIGDLVTLYTFDLKYYTEPCSVNSPSSLIKNPLSSYGDFYSCEEARLEFINGFSDSEFDTIQESVLQLTHIVFSGDYTPKKFSNLVGDAFVDSADDTLKICCPVELQDNGYYLGGGPQLLSIVDCRIALATLGIKLSDAQENGKLDPSLCQSYSPSSGSSVLENDRYSFPSLALGPNNNNQILYLPEAGVYKIHTASPDSGELLLFSNQDGKHLFYENRDGVKGYQPPLNPRSPKKNEDIILDTSSVVLSTSKETMTEEIPLKEGVNIISFSFLPSFGARNQLDSVLFLKIVNQTGYKVSRISYFSGSQWAGGTTYDFKTGETKGAPFPLSQGKGYIVVAERDTTITVPGYKTNGSIPIAFSSGWNLVGVHGHTTAYTAKSLINSINSIEGLQANNVTYWPTSKGMYQGFQLSEGQEYGQDFPISKDLGYFVRINDFKALKEGCKSINWNPGGQKNGECN